MKKEKSKIMRRSMQNWKQGKGKKNTVWNIGVRNEKKVQNEM